jgi:DnaD/phage-associated family protein
MKMKSDIAKKLGKRNGLTQYEEAYIEKWTDEYGYDMSIIEIALKRTTFRSAPSFEYINNIITDWHDRNLKTPMQVNQFLEQRKKQVKDTKELKTQVQKESFDQRKYSNLDFLYANKIPEGGGDAS